MILIASLDSLLLTTVLIPKSHKLTQKGIFGVIHSLLIQDLQAQVFRGPTNVTYMKKLTEEELRGTLDSMTHAKWVAFN